MAKASRKSPKGATKPKKRKTLVVNKVRGKSRPKTPVQKRVPKKAPKKRTRITLTELRNQARKLGITGYSRLTREKLTRKIREALKRKQAEKQAREARIKAREKAERARERAFAKKEQAAKLEHARIIRNARARARRAALKLLRQAEKQAHVTPVPPPPPSTEEPLTEEWPPESEPLPPRLPDTAPISEREIRQKEIEAAFDKKVEKQQIADEANKRIMDTWIEQHKPEYMTSIIDGSIRLVPSRARTDVMAANWHERLNQWPRGSKGWQNEITKIMEEAANAGNYYSAREIWTLGVSP